MADLSNLKISESYQRVLQRDPTTGFLQDLLGDIPSNIIFNGTTLRYIDGNQQNGYVLTSDANGNASWAPAGGGGVEVYWSSSTADSNAIVNSGLTTSKVGIGTTIPNHELSVSGTVSASTSYVVGNATLTTSELDISSGDFTLDVEGDITLDANGADIILSDDGTDFGRFKRDTSDFVIKSESNNNDILFKGQDGGSTITALQLDMSEAGLAIFNDSVNLNNNKYIQGKEIDGTSRNILGVTVNDVVNVGDSNLPTEVRATNIRLSARTFIGTIDNAGSSYGEDKILVAQGDGEVEYLNRTDLSDYLSIRNYFTASTANANAIVNSGMTTSKVGIGTTIPNHELSVSGSVSATSTIYGLDLEIGDDGKIFEESTNLVIQSTQSNSDILIHGSDGGTPVNAARFDIGSNNLIVKGTVILSGDSTKGNYAIGGGQGLENTLWLSPMDFASASLSIASGGRSGTPGYIRGAGYLQASSLGVAQYASYVVPYGYRVYKAACYASAGSCKIYSASPVNLNSTTALSSLAVRDDGICGNFTSLTTNVESDGCGSHVVIEWTPAGSSDALYGAGLVMEST